MFLNQYKINFIFIFFSVIFFAQNKWNFRIYNEVVGREVFVYADNNELQPMSAKLDFKLQNMSSSLGNNQVFVVPPKTLKFLVAKLNPIKINAANKFSYTSTYNFGNVLQESYDKDYIYWLPFEKGKTQLVFQGYNGNLSHQNANALDFNLQTGEKIFAAREGLVVEVAEDNTRNCPDISCAKFNNKIIILHSDGTFAEYLHLKFNGAEVNVGDNVTKGQFIGYSGNTGYSTGPHLHFSVFINRMDGSRTFLKTNFKTSKSESELLEEKKSYTRNY